MKLFKCFLVLAIAIPVVTLYSCKKDDKKDTSPASGFSAKIDGAAVDYGKNAKAQKTTTPDGISIVSVVGATSSGEGIVLVLTTTPVAGKTYTSEGQIILLSKEGYHITDPEATDNSSAITVTSVSNTAISGTFKGKVIIPGNPNMPNSTPIAKVITDGQFSVSF